MPRIRPRVTETGKSPEGAGIGGVSFGPGLVVILALSPRPLAHPDL
jgi:hypothetical protein